MRSASSVCPLHPVSPVLRGRALKEEGDSKKRPHMTLTDIKRPQAIAVVSKYLVYQGSSGVLVSRDTLCLMTPLTALENAQQFMPKVRKWMNSHIWLVNIIVCVVFIVLILA